MWTDRLHRPHRLGGPQRFKAGDKISNGPQVGTLATSPMPSGGPQRFKAGDNISNGPQVGRLATSPPPSRGSSTLQSRGQNQQWPTSGHIGYISLAVLGDPNASKRGTKSAMAHKCADWLHHPHRLGGPQRFKAGDKISTGPQVERLATSPVPSWGSPTLQSGIKNQQWPRLGQIGYISLAILGVPNASKRGTKSAMAHKWADWLH